MEHHFNTDIAKTYGVPEAIFIHNLYFWILKNQCNGRHFYEGRNWTYNSLTALEKIFPYFSRSQIRRIIDRCVKSGAVLKGNFNKKGYDKTNWFALTSEALAVYGGYAENSTSYAENNIDCAESDTAYAEIVTPIPNNKPYINTNSKPNKESGARFAPPTVSDVQTYCKERRNDVDPERFVDFYTAKGWKIGKDPMKDWKAAVRTWERRDKEETQEPTRKERNLAGIIRV